MTAHSLIDLVGAIYDAASENLAWTELGDRLCAVLGAERAYLGLPQADGTLPNLLRAGDPDDTAYAEHYHRLDPLRAIAAQDAMQDRRARRGSEMLPADALRRSGDYAAYARRRGTRHSLGGRLDDRGQVLLGIFRGAAGGAFSDAELDAFERLLPHLQRALQMRRVLATARRDAAQPTDLRAGLAALDVLPMAVILVDAAMHVLFANAAAERLTADPDSGLNIIGLGVRAGQGTFLTAAHVAHAGPLRRLVASAAAQGPGGALRLQGGRDRVSSLAVLVAPAPARLVAANPAGAPEGMAPGLAMVVARDLAAPAAPPAQLLSEMFRLSHGEAAVATALLGGATAEHVAAMRQVSLNTVRRQVQTILHKTEATNLRDLERIAALLVGMAPDGRN